MMHIGAASATNAAGMEMNAIASAIIGGTILTGRDSSPAGFFVFLCFWQKSFGTRWRDAQKSIGNMTKS